MATVDLNADVGEECGDDAALLAIVTSANVAAGGHAGGGEVLTETVRLAAALEVAVGAHPSYPDRPSFGRTSRLEEHGHHGVRAFVGEQVSLVVEACRRQGVVMTHVKAHGALYADVGADPGVARAFLQGVLDAVSSAPGPRPAVMGAAGSELEVACARHGIEFLAEVFADRAYAPTGALVPRSAPGAVLHDPRTVAERAARMVVHGEVEAIDGSPVRVVGETVCLHGDTPGAIEMARAVREALVASGVDVARHDQTRARSAHTAGWYGDSAVSVGIADVGERLEAASRLSHALPRHEVRVGMASILVVADEPEPDLLDVVSDLLATARQSAPDSAASLRTALLEVRYDGADLALVASTLGVAVSDLVSAHQRQAWRVAMMGFAPGFGYLIPDGIETLPWGLLPRRATPRSSVPPGSVALAAGMSAVYPVEMPGGWHLIGSCEETLFDPGNEASPSLLAPGDLVRFRGSLP